MRTSRKRYLRSGEEDHYRSNFARKHPRRQPTDEVFKCRHCRRFIGPLLYGGHHRNHCPFWTEWTVHTVHSSTEELTRRKPRYKQTEEVFKCRHCHRFVCPPEYGSHHRNHCPFCLFSRHVDEKRPGDRISTCGASMEPIGYFQRSNEEYVIVHRCLGCGFERFNRIAADDDFDLVLSLPELPPRTSREMKAQRLEEEIGEEFEKSSI